MSDVRVFSFEVNHFLIGKEKFCIFLKISFFLCPNDTGVAKIQDKFYEKTTQFKQTRSFLEVAR